MNKQANTIFDLSNLVFITHFSVLRETNNEFSKDYLFFKTIQGMKYLWGLYKTSGVVIACDAKRNWRKEFYPDYKKGRKEKRDPYYDDVIETIDKLKMFFTHYTSIPVIEIDFCEADDIIYYLVLNSGVGSVIISSDTDFVQLTNENVILYSPSQKKEYHVEDTDYELFLKCIRGDSSDNIASAYPRVRTTVIEEVYKTNDPFKKVSFFETINKNGERVSDVYERNRELIDLSRIPRCLVEKISETVSNLVINKYSITNMLKFIGQNDLKEVSKELISQDSFFKKTILQKRGD